MTDELKTAMRAGAYAIRQKYANYPGRYVFDVHSDNPKYMDFLKAAEILEKAVQEDQPKVKYLEEGEH